jgi:hypothetical protein
MQIDRSESQCENAHPPRIETRQSLSNFTDTIEQQLKDPNKILSISFPIMTFPSIPKYRTTETPPTSTRKSPLTPKIRFPTSTMTLLMQERVNVRPVSSRTPAGMQIDSSDEHPTNTSSLKTDSREPGSNVTFRSPVQSPKQDLQIRSIDGGIRIDSSEMHP